MAVKKEEEGQTITEKPKDCFVIMPISDPDGYDSDHFQRVYSHLIKKAVRAAGFNPKRADDVKSTNYIIIDILKRIIESDLVICDLSSKNPNVMYELGIRQAFNLPSVLISDGKTGRIFDIQGLRTVKYDENLRVDLVQDDIMNITNAINETISADTEDVNSLIQLLGISKAELSNSTEVSADTNILMNGIRDIAQRMTRLEDLTILKTTNRQSSGPIVSGVHRSIPKMSPKIEAEITDAIRDRITKNSITDISTILNDTRFMSYLKDLFRLGFPSTTKISSRFYEAIIANIIEEVMKDFAPSFL